MASENGNRAVDAAVTDRSRGRSTSAAAGPVRISHYFEFADQVIGGIRESVAHQRRIFDRLGVEYTTEPTLDADVFHANLLGPRSVWYARRARSADVPVVAHAHVTSEDFGDSFRFSNALARPLGHYLSWAYDHADALVCPSAYTQSLVTGYTDVPTTVISNGVDREKLTGFESLREEYLRRYDLDPPVVFAVGHVFERKGLATFVELARRRPDLEFAWFGPLDLRLKSRTTRQLVETAPENCTFTGYLEDIRGAYAAGDVFCFPSHEENEGIAVLEAMAAGIPPVVRDIEAFSWLEDGESCLKVGGVEAFARALDRLTDTELRERLGSSARARSEAFSLAALTEEYRSLYRSVTR